MKKSTPNGLSRRAFLGAAGVGAMALGLGNAKEVMALGPVTKGRASSKTLVVVFLRGGADALNIVIPYKDELYRKYRPTISVPLQAEEGEKPVIPLDERFGLHPSLEPLKRWYDAGRFAPIVLTGSPHPTRSHFDAQDFMEYAAPGLRTAKDGWLNRFLSATATTNNADALRGVAMQKLLPRALRGNYPAIAVSERRSDDISSVLDTFDPLYGDDPEMSEGSMTSREDDSAAVQVGRETIERLRKVYAVLDGSSPETTNVKSYGRGDLSRRMARIAKLIKADVGCEAVTVDVSGWDHHINEGATTEALGRDLTNLGQGLAGFAEDLGERLKDVLVLVVSEFGRTVMENGNRGTDHGHGSCVLALGGPVVGGRIHGRWTGLEERALYEGRDLQATTDFRSVFDDALRSFMGFTPDAAFFPKYDRQKPIGYLAG